MFLKTICLGLPHIHGVAWIDPDWLKNFGIYGNLIDYPEKTTELADTLVSCSIATTDKELNSIVKDVQKHNHSKVLLACMRERFRLMPSKGDLAKFERLKQRRDAYLAKHKQG